MTKKRKSIVVLLLSFAMIVSLVSVKPVTVYADGEEQIVENAEGQTEESVEATEEKKEEQPAQETEVVVEPTEQVSEDEADVDAVDGNVEDAVADISETEEDEIDQDEVVLTVEADEPNQSAPVVLLAALAAGDGTDVGTGDSGSDSGNNAKAAEPVKIIYHYNKNKIHEDSDIFFTDDKQTVGTITIIREMPIWEGTIFDYAFSGWSTDPTASPSNNLIHPNVTYEVEGDTHLYAIWNEYKWGETLTASLGTEGKIDTDKRTVTFVYDGNVHTISGVDETPNPDRKTTLPDDSLPHEGHNVSFVDGYFYQDLWYSLNVWRYTYVGGVSASIKDVGQSTTPPSAPMYAEIWYPWPFDNSWVLIEGTTTEIIPATIMITQASLTVKAPDQRKVYTGSDITPEGELVGLVTPKSGEQETAGLVMDSFTEVGEHPIKYTIIWNDKSENPEYTAKESNYIITEDLGTLTIYYELKFDTNGGKGGPADMEVESNSATIPNGAPSKNGYTFVGWTTSSNAKSVQYRAGDTINLSNNTTLYAVYILSTPVPIPKTGIERKVTVNKTQEIVAPETVAQNNGTSYQRVLFVAGLAVALAAIEKKRLSK